MKRRLALSHLQMQGNHGTVSTSSRHPGTFQVVDMSVTWQTPSPMVKDVFLTELVIRNSYSWLSSSCQIPIRGCLLLVRYTLHNGRVRCDGCGTLLCRTDYVRRWPKCALLYGTAAVPYQGLLSSFFLGIDWFDSWVFEFDYQALW